MSSKSILISYAESKANRQDIDEFSLSFTEQVRQCSRLVETHFLIQVCCRFIIFAGRDQRFSEPPIISCKELLRIFNDCAKQPLSATSSSEAFVNPKVTDLRQSVMFFFHARGFGIKLYPQTQTSTRNWATRRQTLLPYLGETKPTSTKRLCCEHVF